MKPSAEAPWQRSVIYQIYPRSFQDSNGDGIGDLPGITSRLDYLQRLGVDVIWLSPVYASPNDDNGYDISDHRAIDPTFGTMADFDAMLAAMRARGIRLMMDLVVNHTSDEHDWFVQARSSRSNPFHDHYIWREPRDGREPNNWEAAFGGSAWEWNEATGEYYLHLFSRKQPDLNWENPEVRSEVREIMHFWLDKGVGGFRMDVINMISKRFDADGRLPDAPVVRPGFLQPAFASVVHGPRLFEYLLEIKHELLVYHDCLTVGEAPLATAREGRKLTHRHSGVLDMLFQFEHVMLDQQPHGSKWDLKPLDLRELKASMARWQHALADHGWNSLYLGNHDQPRAVSRFGDDTTHRVESAKLLATWLHLHQGTPFVYQGDELGMTNARFASIGDYRDLETLNHHREAIARPDTDPAQLMQAIQAKSRDNARTPMQWSAGAQAGFTSGTPWLAVNPNHREINAEQALADPGSVFHHVRRLIALRRQHAVIVHGRHAQLLPDDPQIDAYTRTLGAQVLLVLCNFSAQPRAFDWPGPLRGAGSQRLLIGNLPDLPPSTGTGIVLRAWEALAYLFEKPA